MDFVRGISELHLFSDFPVREGNKFLSSELLARLTVELIF